MGVFGSLASWLGFGATKPTPLTEPNGGDGVMSFGGYLTSEERRPELTGAQKWVTYANAYNTAVIATGLRLRANLLGGTKWHAKPNPRGGRDADRGVEIVEQGLLTAQMPRPWSAVVRKQSLYVFGGFELHEWTTRRRDDGMIVFAELGHRPAHTIDRWDKPDEREPWQAVGQLSRNGNRYTIPRERLFYCFDDTITDSPDGVGLMRHVVELVRRLNVLEGLEGIGYETDLRGMPIGRAPIKDLLAQAEAKFGDDKDAVNAEVAKKTKNLRDTLTKIAKSPEALQYLLLDSSVYTGVDQNTISTVQRWAFELLRGDSRGLPDINAAINRLQLEIARVLGIEFVMMGASSTGSLAMHGDKTSLLHVSLQTALAEMAGCATRDLASPLVALNGLDPDTCTPTLEAEPISTEAVLTTCQALQALAASALPVGSPQRNAILERLQLPAEDEPGPELAGMLGLGRRGPKSRGMPPDPARGEVDIPVDDLGSPAAKRPRPARRSTP